jgi:hypothetical protein
MLINTSSTTPEVGLPITLKLVTGEEVIGKVTSVTANDLTLLKPCVIFINPQNSQLGIQNLILSADHEKPVVFNRSVIVAYSASERGIAEHYLSALTGIIKAPPGLQL